jgi:integrase/recombinase XerC
MAEALAEYLAYLAAKRGRSGRVTSSETVRAYTAALPRAFAGISTVVELGTEAGAERLRANMRHAWGGRSPATWNTRRAAVASALSYFHAQDWLPAGADPLDGVSREYEPKPESRVRDRDAIDRLITSRSRSLQDRALWALLYSSAARCEEALRLNIEDLDRARRRARVTRKGGARDELMYDTRTAALLGQHLRGREAGPVFLSDRHPTDGTVPTEDLDPGSGRRRMSYHTAARHLRNATGGWRLHDLRHSRLTHAGEGGASEADLMNLSGHEDRRTLQRYLAPSKEGTQARLDAIDAARGTWPPDAAEIADRLAGQDTNPHDETTEPAPTPAGAGEDRAGPGERPEPQRRSVDQAGPGEAVEPSGGHAGEETPPEPAAPEEPGELGQAEDARVTGPEAAGAAAGGTGSTARAGRRRPRRREPYADVRAAMFDGDPYGLERGADAETWWVTEAGTRIGMVKRHHDPTIRARRWEPWEINPPRPVEKTTYPSRAKAAAAVVDKQRRLAARGTKPRRTRRR